jgi:hypothetical protein
MSKEGLCVLFLFISFSPLSASNLIYPCMVKILDVIFASECKRESEYYKCFGILDFYLFKE